jgi:hypothetical protein
MPPGSHTHLSSFITLLLAMLSFVCSAKDTLQAFTTDGCSRFPDRALIGKADWCSCCVAHDLAYWRGGTAEARLNADRALKICVQRATNNEALADAMFAGVRAGGGPHFHTPYRWGYGWAFGRPYRPLTPEEEALASSLEAEYLATNPTLSCPGKRSQDGLHSGLRPGASNLSLTIEDFMKVELKVARIVDAGQVDGANPGIFLLSPDTGARPGMRVK